MHGAEGLSYADIDAWARLTGRAPEPCEVEALFQLDVAMRFPRDLTEEQ